MCFFPPSKGSHSKTKQRSLHVPSHASSQHYNLNSQHPPTSFIKTKTKYSSKPSVTIETTYYSPPPWDLPTTSNSYHTSSNPALEYQPSPHTTHPHSHSQNEKQLHRTSILSDIDFMQTLGSKLHPIKHSDLATTTTKEADKRATEELRAEVGRLRREREIDEWRKELGVLRREVQEQRREGEWSTAVSRARGEGVKEGEERTRREKEREREVQLQIQLEVEREREKLRAVEREYIRERDRQRELETEKEKLRILEREHAKDLARERERMMFIFGENNNRLSATHPMSRTPNETTAWHFHINGVPHSNSTSGVGTDSAATASFEPFGRGERRNGVTDRDRELWNAAAGEVRVLGRRMTRVEDVQADMVESLERERDRRMERLMRGRRYWD